MIGVIFDLDGVIVDTARFHFLAWKKLADELGIPFDEKKNEKLRGLSRRDSLLAMVGHPLPEERIVELTERKNNYYLEYLEMLSPAHILPGAKELLEELRERKVKIALASSSKNAKKVLEKIGLRNVFDVIVDGYDIKKAKPDPEIFLLTAKRLEENPSHCVVIEDAQAGITAAKRAGMFAVGIGNPQILKGADIVVKGVYELDADRLLNLVNNK